MKGSEDSMTVVQIKEFKSFVKQALMKIYGMNEINAQRAVRDSYLSQALKRDKNYVDHDTVEEWAEFIYNEIKGGELLQM